MHIAIANFYLLTVTGPKEPEVSVAWKRRAPPTPSLFLNEYNGLCDFNGLSRFLNQYN